MYFVTSSIYFCILEGQERVSQTFMTNINSEFIAIVCFKIFYYTVTIQKNSIVLNFITLGFEKFWRIFSGSNYETY